ncbi:SRPBCC family protein [Streptomyces lichenis]|uniref:SRPBCC family protein n=1 Tax=Streptomyces lichenis TaxID=2306967 RepID=A0ABT0IDX7_9ACTN|nr:SRPBCC family protein [Streptomyces lichenis]MCK8679539.1 SRPBCC family protein [Streptomyces lichenis]
MSEQEATGTARSAKETAGGLSGALGDAGDRLKDELRQYLEAKAGRAVGSLGGRLGEATRRLGDPGSSLGNVAGALGKGGQALAEGKSPQRAVAGAAFSHVKDTVKDKVSGLFGGGKGGKSGKGETRGKSVVVIEDVDVGVPVRQAYDQWTQFQQFGRFAKGVVNVEQSDDTTSQWQVKVAKSNRNWKASVLEQVPDERIVWSSEGAKGTTKGAVTFHALGDNLTKVLLVLEYFPKGLFEKTGNIWRAQGRRARLDLKLYRKFVTMQSEPAEGWRGEIRDGEVVRSHEDAEAEENEDNEEHEDNESTGEESGADEPDTDEDREDDDEPYEDEEYEDEDEPEPEDEEAEYEDEDQDEDEEEDDYGEDEPEYEDDEEEEDRAPRRRAGRR